MASPFFSVVMPVYNVAEPLVASVSSVLAQDDKDFELILVNDGSTDASPDICDAYAARYAFIRVIHKPNGGLASARNAGIEVARGQYIVMPDSDDLIDPDTLSTVRRALDEARQTGAAPVDIVRYDLIRHVGTDTYPFPTCVPAGIYDGEKINRLLDAALLSMDDYTLSACTHAYRREFLNEQHLRFVSEREVLSEDYLFNLCALITARSVYVTNRQLYHYICREGSLTTSNKHRMFERYTALYQELVAFAQAHHADALLESKVATFYVNRLVYRNCIKVEYIRSKQHTLRQGRKNVRKMLRNKTLKSAAAKMYLSSLSSQDRVRMLCVRVGLELPFLYFFRQYAFKARKGATAMTILSALKRLHLNRAVLALAAPFCRADRTALSADEARRTLNDFFPRREETGLLAAPRTWPTPECDVSVVIPSYNNGRFTDEVVHSALNQETSARFEVIFIDDGSTDNTAEVLSRIRDERLRIITQENRGVSEARNAGIDAARGEYICLLDGDDILLPGALEALMACAWEHRADVVQGGYTMIDERGEDLSVHPGVSGALNPTAQLNGFVWGKVIRKDLLANIRFPGRICFEDSLIAQVLNPLVAQQGGTAWGIAQTVVGYRLNLAGFSQTYSAQAKSVDTVWTTDVLRETRAALNLSDTQEYYEHMLDMAALSCRRTWAGIPDAVHRAVFAMYCEFAREVGAGKSTRQKRQALMERALRTNNFSLYALVSLLG